MIKTVGLLTRKEGLSHAPTLPSPPPRAGEGRVGVYWSIVIGSRTVACCFSTIWVMLLPIWFNTRYIVVP